MSDWDKGKQNNYMMSIDADGKVQVNTEHPQISEVKDGEGRWFRATLPIGESRTFIHDWDEKHQGPRVTQVEGRWKWWFNFRRRIWEWWHRDKEWDG